MWCIIRGKANRRQGMKKIYWCTNLFSLLPNPIEKVNVDWDYCRLNPKSSIVEWIGLLKKWNNYDTRSRYISGSCITPSTTNLLRSYMNNNIAIDWHSMLCSWSDSGPSCITDRKLHRKWFIRIRRFYHVIHLLAIHTEHYTQMHPFTTSKSEWNYGEFDMPMPIRMDYKYKGSITLTELQMKFGRTSETCNLKPRALPMGPLMGLPLCDWSLWLFCR